MLALVSESDTLKLAIHFEHDSPIASSDSARSEPARCEQDCRCIVVCTKSQRCRAIDGWLTPAKVHRLTSSMQLQACSRLWPGVCRLRLLRNNNYIVCRAFSAKSSEPKATPALLDKIKDKELLKVHGFIGGQWVSASDGTTMEVKTPATAPPAAEQGPIEASRFTRQLQACVLHLPSSPMQ